MPLEAQATGEMSMSTKTYMAKKGELARRWYLVDVSGRILGRAATKIATILMGKHRPEYTPHVDTGDFVIVVNASKVKFTGAAKPEQRDYQSYSKYPGGLKITPLKKMLAVKPDMVVIEAVRRMLPKNKIGMAMLTKLKVYAGNDHPHQAQMPQPLDLK
jgi:large subunit ribosomal protein L13